MDAVRHVALNAGRCALGLALTLLGGCHEVSGVAHWSADGVYNEHWAMDPSQEIFSPANLPRFDLDISNAALAQLSRTPRDWVDAVLRYRHERVLVRVRLKGDTSFRTLDGKPSFRVRFRGARHRSRRFHDLRDLTLNAAVQDPSFLAERLSYELFRAAGVPAPRANNALVYVNGVYYGVYVNVETEDEAFLQRWFSSEDGHLYEEGGHDIDLAHVNTFDLETAPDGAQHADLAALARALDTAGRERYMEEIAAHIDVDAFLRFAASEFLVGHWDGYNFGDGFTNNYRLYRDPAAQRFVFLPWGLDQSLSPKFEPALVHPWLDPGPQYLRLADANGRVLVGCLESPACKQRFADVLSELTDRFEVEQLDARVWAYFAQIHPHVAADPRREASLPTIETTLRTMEEYILGRAEAARAEIAAARQ